MACTGPCADNSATATASSAFLRLDRYTVAPARSSPRAIITPMPRPPPVTTATFPSRRNKSVMGSSLAVQSVSSGTATGCTNLSFYTKWRLDADRLVADQTPQQRGAEFGGDLLGAAASARPKPAVGAQRHPDVAERQDVRVAFIELAAGNAAIDQPVHVLVDLSFLLTDRGDLVVGEPFGDVGLLLEVHRRAFGV